MMEPSEFLTRDEFDALTEAEQEEYGERFITAHSSLQSKGADNATQFAFLKHTVELAEWVLPPEEYEKTYGLMFWNLAWEKAEELHDTMVALLDSEEIHETDKDNLRATIQRVEAVIALKRDLNEIQGTEDAE